LLKIAGIFYLLWLGAQLIRSGLGAQELAFSKNEKVITLKDAWLANVLNPKAILFYLTVVSQFAGRQGEVSHYLALASVHVAVMAVWLIALSLLLITSARKINTRALKRAINMGGGALLILFALLNLLH
ncbi:LysE family transporter, partial [Cronobacter sakazakii]